MIDLDTIEWAAKAATPGPYKHDSNGEVTVIRAPDGSRLAQLTYLTKAGRRNADEVSATARMIASLDPATVLEIVRLARIGRVVERGEYVHRDTIIQGEHEYDEEQP